MKTKTPNYWNELVRFVNNENNDVEQRHIGTLLLNQRNTAAGQMIDSEIESFLIYNGALPPLA